MSYETLMGSSPVEWNRECTVRFIKVYREHPCLWKAKSEIYKDRLAKADAMKNILEHMRDLLPSITLDDVRKKINTLRSQYRREAKSFLAWKQSGGETHVYRPKLWCFTALEFLSEADVSGNHSIPPMDGDTADHHGLEMDQEESHGMYTMEDEIAMAQLAMEEGAGDEGLCVGAHPAVGNRPVKKKARLDPTGELLRLAMSKIASPPNEPSIEDEDSRFGKVVADELRNMSASQKCFTKKVINEAIFLGSMGAMDPSAHVVNSGNANKIITSSMNG